MNVDISNMVINIGEQFSKINWLDVGVTFISVFLGAFWAYKFGLKLEMLKAKRQMRGDFCSLSAEVQLKLSEFLRYKENFLDNMLRLHNEEKLPSKENFLMFPQLSFSFDFNRYIFLSDCNRAFLSEMQTLKNIEDLLKTTKNDYVNNLKNTLNNKNLKAIKALQFSFENLYQIYVLMCVKLYYFNKHLCECYARFFNVYYFENIKDEYKIIEEYHNLDKDIKEGISHSSNIQWDKEFNFYWQQPMSIKCYFCLYWRILKNKIQKVKHFFIKPIKCKNCSACKFKKRKK